MLTLDLDAFARPAEETARLLALSFLDDAGEAMKRLGHGRDPEALHDFRVALRRLRSLLRAYAAQFAGTVRKKLQKRLRDLARATGVGRDSEVQLSWLKQRKAALTARQRIGYRWLTKQLGERLDSAYKRLHEVIAKEFRGLEKALRAKLTFCRIEVGAGGAPSREAFESVASRLIAEHASALKSRAQAIGSANDVEAQHETRIRAKRLRYILEPFAGPLAGADSAVEQLKALQDLLGELNDMHVLSVELAIAREAAAGEKAASAGIARIARLVGAEASRLYSRVESEWLRGQLDSLMENVEGLAVALHANLERGVEIERKFLLKRLPAAARAIAPCEIDQGWLPGAVIEERVRRLKEGGTERYYRTVKVGTSLRRTELEEEMEKCTFDALWRLTRGRRVRKKRYRVPEDGLLWEIDKFSGRKLILAEVELPSEDTPVEVPPWLSPCVVREVTGDPRYYNVNLAR